VSLVRYPHLPAENVDRQGQAWLFCDVGSCDAQVEVTGLEEATVGGHTYRYAQMPDGWVTNDPEDNALHGAAQFCPTHANRIVKPDPDAPDAPVVTEPAPEPQPEPGPAQ